MPSEPVSIAAQSESKVPKEVVGQDHVELLGRADKLHGAIIGIHVAQLHVRVFLVMDQLGFLAPQDAAFHHIRLFDRTDPVAAAARKFKGRPGHALDFGGGVPLGVDAHTVPAFARNAAAARRNRRPRSARARS